MQKTLVSSIYPFEGYAIAQNTEVKPTPQLPVQLPVQFDGTTAALVGSCGLLAFHFLKTQLENFNKRSVIEADRDISNQNSTQKLIEAMLNQQRIASEQQQLRYDELMKSQRSDLSSLITVVTENNQVIKRVLDVIERLEQQK